MRGHMGGSNQELAIRLSGAEVSPPSVRLADIGGAWWEESPRMRVCVSEHLGSQLGSSLARSISRTTGRA